LAQTQTEEEADAHEQVATASQEVQEIEELQESQEQVCDSQETTTDSSDDQVPLEADQAEPDSVVELPESEVVTDEVLSTQADTQETEEEQALQHTEPEPGVVSGVPEDEVVQREQSHYLRGLEAGKQQVRQELEQQVKDQCAVLASVSEQLNTLLQEQAKLYAPLKRLSLHIAQQLVLGELKQPTEIVERLVQRCLDELNLPQNGLVSVELNEQDKALLEAQDSQLLQGMRLEVASDLLSGSVRVKANDTIVEDFVQDRLKSVVKALSLEDASWESNSVLLHDQDQQEETGE
jgi:hypothetical protein